MKAPGSQESNAATSELKRARTLASEIQDDIRRLGQPIGVVLGSEAELLDRYKVSRAVFREAVRLLEHAGVARMRRGPLGGLQVTAPNADPIISSVATYLEYLQISSLQVFEVRTWLELEAVEIASSNIDDTGVELLQATLADEVESGRAGDYDFRAFHLAVADLTGNPAVRLFVEVMANLTSRRSEVVHGGQSSRTARGADEMHRAHKAIARAIANGDPALARRRMLRHLEGMHPWLREVDGNPHSG